MSAACGCEHDELETTISEEAEEAEHPWWRDRGIMVPVFSGIAFLTGLVLEWSGMEIPALVLFWIGLLLGASTFTPGAIRKLFKGKLGIGLLMTISAVGAVILGYVEEAAALAFLYSIAEALEDKAMDRARGGLRALLKLVPETATVRRDGTSVEVPAKDLQVGQLMLVRPGERIATDGIVRTGRSSLDTSAITGESIPVEVEPGDTVSAGAINTAGALEVETTAAGTDNSLTTIVDLVEKAQAEKGDRARLADRIARPLVPGVLILAALVAIIGSLFGDPEPWIARALVVLVAASPCALAISVPLTVVAAIGSASKFGVIIKSGAAFERFGVIRHVAVDKTGTLTRNRPEVIDVATTGGATRGDVLNVAAALEARSEHPLAAAILAAVDDYTPAEDVDAVPGAGLTGHVGGIPARLGRPGWIDPGPLAADIERMQHAGATAVLIECDGALIGAVAVRDELRPEARDVVAELRRDGYTVAMLTGDNERTARALAAAVGIDEVHADLRPEDKARIIDTLRGTRPTAMVGDGVNDAPALATADLGIAMGAMGTDVAIETADVALMGEDLRHLPQALQHARRSRTIMLQNVGLSLAIITVLMPLALFGILGLAAVVLVHEIAEIIVIANGVRAGHARSLTATTESTKSSVPVAGARS